ncbi:MAG: helix-turn-helix transcriptional regulator [Pseudomonadota bacterium]
MRLGLMITAYQQKHDIESKDLADQIGISVSSLSHIRSGKSPNAAGLVKIITWMTASEAAPAEISGPETPLLMGPDDGIAPTAVDTDNA